MGTQNDEGIWSGRIDQSELDKIVHDHETWLSTDWRSGRRAQLEGANLQKLRFSTGASLRKARFVNCDLSFSQTCRADFTDAVLQHCQFREADLTEAKFTNATIPKTTFRDADLSGADLDGASELLAKQLAGTNLSSAMLPNHIRLPDQLKNTDDSSRQCRNLFVSMLLACLYAIITIGSTTDDKLITNSASSPLPLVGVSIPIVGFYVVTPFLLFAAYQYFHLYLQRLWEKLAQMPFVLPDGRFLDEITYPWLVTGVVRMFSDARRVRARNPRFWRTQYLLSFVLAWWIVPITLFVFWLTFLDRQDSQWTLVHIVLLGVTFAMGYIHFIGAWRTLARERLDYKLRNATPLGIALVTLVVAGACSYSFLSYWLILGADIAEKDIATKPSNWKVPELKLDKPSENKSAIGPTSLGPWRYATTTEDQVSAARESAIDQNRKQLKEAIAEYIAGYALVKGADLRGRRLVRAYALRTFFAMSNMSEVNLYDASLIEADLTGVNLEGAMLDEAKLTGARLIGANLLGASLRGSELGKTDLRGAQLSTADFSGATIIGAHFSVAEMNSVYFSNAVLRGVHGLDDRDLRTCDFRDAKLVGINFSGSNLRGSDFRGANLKGAFVRSTSFSHVDFRGANLEKLNGWSEISDIKIANIHGVKNAPDGFVEWALNKGAFSVESDDEWHRLIQNSRSNSSISPLCSSGWATRTIRTRP